MPGKPKHNNPTATNTPSVRIGVCGEATMGFGLLKLKSVTMKLSQFAKEMLELYTAEDN